MSYTYEENLVSDLHKDAYGMRPGQRFWDEWKSYSEDEKQECWDLLIKDLYLADALQKKEEAEALVTFRNLVRKTMNLCSCKWDDAIRMLCEAWGEDHTCDQGLMHFFWKHDLGYEDSQKIFNLYRKAA